MVNSRKKTQKPEIICSMWVVGEIWSVLNRAQMNLSFKTKPRVALGETGQVD